MNKINTKLLFAYILFAFVILSLHAITVNSYPVGACDIENCEDEIADELDDEELDPWYHPIDNDLEQSIFNIVSFDLSFLYTLVNEINDLDAD
ncbi:19245_t:CDS:2 [Funneliformis geosporum]|uniref:19245_t:CDS:1 n=1 Tax=Funneliformis geosporum TaxID=1117311 RepID=A0A9W4SZ91_9GLOM|nr:19245_t:CDS:2 [Funneliformis geosporum]